MRRTLEICVTDFASASNAATGGADCVELCADLASGGITPSAGMIGRVVAHAGLPTHVLIRPRGGDFVYSADELVVMEADIDIAKSLGAAGVVFGVLLAAGRIDLVATAKLIARARPLRVTFHKAIDMTLSPVDSIKPLVGLGVDRILTAGGPGPARANMAVLRRMVDRADGRITVMAGGEIRRGILPDWQENAG